MEELLKYILEEKEDCEWQIEIAKKHKNKALLNQMLTRLCEVERIESRLEYLMGR